MSLPEKSELPHQRRQFGRREVSRAATATLAAGVSAAGRVVNVSEGGALIDFPGGLVPAKPFHLTIDGVPGMLACEPRHIRETAVGVKFLKEADGIRLMAILFPTVRSLGPGDAPRERVETAMAPVAVRDLRQRVLAAFAERAAAPVDALTGSEPSGGAETEKRPAE